MYGEIFPPSGGFAPQAANLGVDNPSAWTTGTSFAPFDQEVPK